MPSNRVFRCGVVGYGRAFNMGRAHLSSMRKAGMVPAAVCELDPACRSAAEQDFPGIATYVRLGQMLRHADLDLVAIITPHNTHAKLALQVLEAGVGAVCEKPMAVTSREVKAMLAASRRRRVMLSAFHNRRWDGDFLLLRDLIHGERVLGRVFRIEAGFGGYGKQQDWWRADRRISGGAIYDWGAHFTDWILNLVDDSIDWVSGYQVKSSEWADAYTNEDHSEYTMRFRGGCLANLMISNLAMSLRPKWRILGDQGSIEAVDKGAYLVKAMVKGRQVEERRVPPESSWDAYYENVRLHLQGRASLAVTPESAARVIGVLEAANISAQRKGGMPVKPAFE